MTKIIQTVKGWTTQDWIFTLFSIFWVGLLSIDYWNKHPLYILSIIHFKFVNLTLFFVLAGFLLGIYYKKKYIFSKIKNPFLNGIIFVFLFLSISLITVVAFNKYWRAPLTLNNYLHLFGLGLGVLGGGLMVCVAAFSAGRRFRKLIIQLDESLAIKLIDLCLGFVIYMFGLFILGTLGFLQRPFVLGYLILLVAINYKESFLLIKHLLWTRIKIPRDINFWGVFFIWACIFILSVNFLYTLAPFPLGFDARTYYVSISKLIFETESLISGFQPYAWSLIMSTGYIGFNSPPITLFISSMGGILCLFVIWDLFTNRFRVNKNYTAGILFLFATTPSLVNQWIVEFKIDLALLFTQLVILNTFFYWIYQLKTVAKSDTQLLTTRNDYKVLIILSILIGFSLSIKVLGMFLIIALFIAIWTLSKDVPGTLAMVLGALGLILVLKLDNISGLRDYHQNPLLIGFIVLIASLILLVISFLRNKDICLQNLKALLFSTFFIGLTFSPWVIKNMIENPSASISGIIFGSNSESGLSVNDIIRNYEDSFNENNN